MTNFKQFLDTNEEVLDALYILHTTYSDTVTTREQLVIDMYHGQNIADRILVYEGDSSPLRTLSYSEWLIINKATLDILTFDQPCEVFHYRSHEEKLLGIARGLVWEIKDN